MTPEQKAAIDKLIASVRGPFDESPEILFPDGSYAYAFRRDDGSITWSLYERRLGPRICGGSIKDAAYVEKMLGDLKP
jgi:hypothetical protein